MKRRVMCGKTHNSRVAKATARFAEMSEAFFQAQDRLEPALGGKSTMLTLNRNRLLGFAAAGAFVTLTALDLPARADELVQHLGPVGPHEPILTTFGNKRVIAFYEPDNGHCAVNAVVYDKTDADTGMTTAARVRVSLDPRQIRAYRQHRQQVDQPSVRRPSGDAQPHR